MARKKNNKNIAPKDEKLIDKPVSGNSLAYQGRVKFQILHGKTVVSTKQFSNNGLPDLFKYLSHALTGVYYSSLRPCKIALYEYPIRADTDDPNNFNWQSAIENNILVAASPYVPYDATPVVTASTSDGITTYSTTFRFKIPFNWLYRKTFNVIGLFTEDTSACAYYLFTKDSANGDGKKEWDTQELDDIVGNFSLVVDWTMEISNK